MLHCSSLSLGGKLIREFVLTTQFDKQIVAFKESEQLLRDIEQEVLKDLEPWKFVILAASIKISQLLNYHHQSFQY